MIQFDDYHNKFLNRILRLTIDGVISWEIVESLNSKRYRGIGNNHVFTVNKSSKLNKNSYVGYIFKSALKYDLDCKWKFVIEDQIIINAFIDKLIDFIETSKDWIKVDKLNNNFIEPETGEILLNDSASLAKKEFDEMIIINTYRALNKSFKED